jgi:F-type H+-transporting ATPase subunit b
MIHLFPVLAAEAAEATSGASAPLGINIGLLLAQIFNFLLLWFILSKFVFPALMRTLDERSAKIAEGIDNAKRAEQELKDADKESARIIQEARLQSQQIISDGSVAAERIRSQLETEARAKADEIVQQGRLRLQQEESQTRNALRQEIATLAISAASQVIGESLDSAKQHRIVAEVK